MANLNNHRNLHIQNDQTGSGSVFARKNTLNTYLQGDAGISDFTAYDARVNSLGGNDNQFFTAGGVLKTTKLSTGYYLGFLLH